MGRQLRYPSLVARSQSWKAGSCAPARMSPEMAYEVSLLRGVCTGSDRVPASVGVRRRDDWLAAARRSSSSERTASLRKASRSAVSRKNGSGTSTEKDDQFLRGGLRVNTFHFVEAVQSSEGGVH